MARSAFRRVGMKEGWKAVDCGCGPIGGLAVMAEMVGLPGRVVGIDISESTIQRAGSVVAALQLGNVELFAGDIHELDAAAVGGPFDLAYTRLSRCTSPTGSGPSATSRASFALAAGSWRKSRCATRRRGHTPISTLSVPTGLCCTS
jgi:SAM-dependent methyltransferase